MSDYSKEYVYAVKNVSEKHKDSKTSHRMWWLSPEKKAFCTICFDLNINCSLQESEKNSRWRWWWGCECLGTEEQKNTKWKRESRKAGQCWSRIIIGTMFRVFFLNIYKLKVNGVRGFTGPLAKLQSKKEREAR